MYNKIAFEDKEPFTSAFYDTDKGTLKYDRFTRSFYDDSRSTVKINYWFEAVKTNDFETTVRPVIKFLCDNYHPHAKIIISPDRAEVVEGVKSTAIIEDYFKD